MTAICSSNLWLDNKIFYKTIWLNLLKFGRKQLWKVLYKVSSKQNDRWETQAQLTEPLVPICCMSYSNMMFHVLAHPTQTIIWYPSSQTQKSSLLKPLSQLEIKLCWIILIGCILSNCVPPTKQLNMVDTINRT
jgi:hypothetical protein